MVREGARGRTSTWGSVRTVAIRAGDVLGSLRRNRRNNSGRGEHSCRHPRRTAGRAQGTDDNKTRLDQSRINSDHSDRDSTAADRPRLLSVGAVATFHLAARAPGPGVPVRYTYVVGTSVHISDDPADPSWPRHVVGVLDRSRSYAVDVPDGDDPSDGAAVDLRRLPRHGRRGGVGWPPAAAVQLVEWARTHRFCGRCGTPTERGAVDGRWTARRAG